MYFTKYVVVADLLDELSVEPESVGFTEDSLEMERELEIDFELVVHDFGRPAVMYLPNGDPGYPAEGPEYELDLKTDLSFLNNTELEIQVERWMDLNYEAIAEEAFNQLTEGEA